MNVKQKISEDPIKIEKFVNTTDDWHPNYEGNKVKIFLMYFKAYEFVRIAVWGNDDFGLELNFIGTSEENFLKFKEWKVTIYDKIPEPCTQEYFKNLGFKPA